MNSTTRLTFSLLSTLFLFTLLGAQFAPLSAQESDEYIYLPVRSSAAGPGRLISVQIDPEVAVLVREEADGWIWIGDQGGVPSVTIENVTIEELATVHLGGEGSTIGEKVSRVEFMIVRNRFDRSGWDLLRRAYTDGVVFTVEESDLLSAAEVANGIADPAPLIHRAVSSAHSVAEKFSADSSLDPELTAPIGKGRFQHSSIVDVLRDVDPDMVSQFLRYVVSDPREFRSPSLPFVQAFVYWAALGGPHSPDSLRSRFLRSSPADFKELLTTHREELTTFDLANDWISIAETRGMDGDVEYARSLLDVCEKIARSTGNDGDLGWVHFVRARVHGSVGESSEAIQEYRRSLPLFESANDSVGLSFALSNLSYALYYADLNDEALEAASRSIAIKEGLLGEDPSSSQLISLASTIDTKGLIYYDNGEPNLAEAEFQKAIDLYDKGSSPQSQALMWYRIGSLWNAHENPEKGLVALMESRELYRKIGDTEGEADALSEIARSYALTDQVDSALSVYAIAGEMYEAQGAPNDGAWMFYRAGLLLSSKGDYVRSRPLLERALKLYGTGGSLEGQADVIDEIAYGYSNEGDFSKSIELYEQAFELHKESGEIDDAGFSRANMGQGYWSLGDYYEAERAHREAILLRQDAGNLSGEAYSWKKIGEMSLDNGDPGAADEALLEAERLYREAGDVEGLTAILNARADLLQDHGTLASSVAAYDSAHQRYLDVGDPFGASDALASIGDILYKNRRFREAGEYYQRARDLLFESGNGEHAFKSTTGLGHVAWSESDLEGAVRWMDEARVMARESGSDDDVAWTLSKIGAIDLTRGRTEEAAQHFQEALDLYLRSGNKDGQIDAYLNIGSMKVEAGEFESAMAEYRKAMKIAEKEGRRGRLSDVMSAVAALQSLVGQFEQALASDSVSLRMARNAENEWDVAGALIGLGNTLNSIGEFKSAHAHYSEADQIFRELGDELGRSTPLNNIGTIWFFQGDYEQALESFIAVLEILKEHNVYNEFLAIVVGNIGEVYYEKGRLEDAEEWLMTAVGIADSVGARRVEASIRTNLAKTLRNRGDLGGAREVALDAHTLSVEVGEIEQLAEITGVLGDIESRLGNIDEGVRLLQESAQHGRRIGSHRYLWRPLYNLGILQRDQNESDNAVASLTESVESIEHMRTRISGGEDAVKLFASDRSRIRVYEALISLLIERGDVETALGYLERSSSEDLRSRFGSTRPTTGEEEGVLKIERKMKARLDRLTEEIVAEQNQKGSQQKIRELQEIRSVAETEYIGFVNRTIVEQPDLKNFFIESVNPIELRSRKKRIPKGIAVVSYLLGDETLFTFVATQDTVVARVVPVSRREIAESVNELYSAVSVAPGTSGVIDGSAKVSENSRQLYRWLIEPIVDQIQGVQKLAVIPSGELQFLSYDLLSSTGTPEEALAQRYAIFYISDLSIFLGEPGESGLPIVAAFANADGTLPYSEGEAEQIVGLFPSSTIYAGTEATELRVKELSPDYTTLHFATHGTLDYRNVENTWLTLAPDQGGGEDGRLTLAEIWGISTLSGYRLVTLSACNTAIGAEIVDGWPVNPANAFLQIGVPSVVASLWRVDDQATAAFMVEFYRNLPEQGAAAALQSARKKLAATEEWGDPYYWAPFILLGDWR